MQDLTSTLFKPYSLVMIRLEGGDSIQGTVISTVDGSIQIEHADGTMVTIDQDLLSHAEYCYVGFPTVKEREVPQIVKGNGNVFNLQPSGLGVGRCLLTSVSLVDPRLRELEKDGTIVGTEVLYVVYKKGSSMAADVAAVIKAGALDEVLDTISLLARQGRIVLAQAFCDLVLKQYPEEEDVLTFSLALDEALEKAKGIDFYAELPKPSDDDLEPYGRIFTIEGNKVHIIDTATHRVLFCDKNTQFFGGLEKMSNEELIGRPVLYSITKNDNRAEGFEARSVLPMMDYVLAGGIAENLFSRGEKKKSACDILRLILDQFKDPYYEKLYNRWTNNFSVRLWNYTLPEKYEGPAKSLFLPLPDICDSLSISRRSTHLKKETDLTGTPDVPCILSLEEMEGIKATIAKTAELSDSLEDDRVSFDESQIAPAPLPSALPDISYCPKANEMIKAKATITVRYRNGSLFVEGESQPFSFSIEDIIDEDLKARAYLYSTKFIQNEPVVCQLWFDGHKATHICPPQSVLSMLTAAKKAIMEARGKDPILDRALVYELYDVADGYISNVLDAFPEHSVAASLKRITEDGLEQYGDFCYRAPSNAIKPCGSILSLSKNKRAYWIKDPLFARPILLPLNNIIDRNYEKHRAGDELVYSVYPGTNSIPVVHFACLARTSMELVDMAEQWEKEEKYEKAWGIAMNILDAKPNHSDARAIADRCLLKVDKDTVQKRQQLLREDLFAQAQIAIAEEDFREAITLLTKIIDEPNENFSLKEQSVLSLLYIYDVMFSDNPGDMALKEEYRRAGEKYALGRHSANFSLNPDSIKGIDAIIDFYEDMGDYVELVNSYQRRLRLLGDKNKITDEDERRSLIAETNAYIAWYSLLVGGSIDDAGRYASRSVNENNDLGRICDAIVKMRRGDGERIIREEGKFLRQNIDTLEEMYVPTMSTRVYSGQGEMKNLTYERFALLCAIVKEDHNASTDGRLLYFLGRYLATLTGNETEYLEYMASTLSIPDDCNFVKQVFKCLRNGSATGRQWADIRLICMLSQEAAYKLSSVLYDLDADTIASMLTRSKIDTRPKPARPYFARQFARWRGVTFQAQYVAYLKKADELEKESSLDKFIEFFRGLEYEAWMIQDDMELINEFRSQLPLLVASFNAAENSRAVKTTSRAIEMNISKWRDLIKDRPTVLMRCAFDRLLMQLRKTVVKIESDHHFSIPVLKAKVLSNSALDSSGSMYAEVEIRNKEKNAEPMLDCSLRFDPSEFILPDILDPVVTFSDTERVYGDESVIYILHFSLKPDADIENLQVQLHFTYKVKAEQKTAEFSLPVKPIKQYKRIINDFNVGSPETERFYGREELIENAVYSLTKETEIPPHYFIFGQKRSGKSSVLIQIENHILQKLPSAIIVEVDFSGIKISKEENIYYWVFSYITTAIQNISDEIEDETMLLDESFLAPPSSEEMEYELFAVRLAKLLAAMKKKPVWADRKLILFVDEFTTAYTWLKEGKIGREFIFRWKNLQKRGLFSAVLIGQDVLHAFIRECDSENAFEVLEKKRLTYLQPDEARRMITDRITEVTGKKESDVFLGNSLSRILQYSASSAFYTKWICKELVDYMNSRQLNKVTATDVDVTVWEMIRNLSQAETNLKFDALLLPGIMGESLFSREQTMAVLDCVVEEEIQNPIRGCSRSTLLARGGDTEGIVEDLLARDVILDPGKKGYYFINVKLYNVWYKVRNNLKR